MVNNSTNKNNNNNPTNVTKSNNKTKEQQNVGATKQQQQQQQNNKSSTKQKQKQQQHSKNAASKKNVANKIDASKEAATTITKATNENTKLQQNAAANSGSNSKSTKLKQQQQPRNWQRNSGNSYAQTVGHDNNNNRSNSNSNTLSAGAKVQSNLFIPKPFATNYAVIKKDTTDSSSSSSSSSDNNNANTKQCSLLATDQPATTMNAADELTAGQGLTCLKCSSPTCHPTNTVYSVLRAPAFVGREYRKSKSYAGSNRSGSGGSTGGGGSSKYRRNSFDRNFAERNRDFVPIAPPEKPIPSETNIACVLTDIHKITLIQRMGKLRRSYPLMQCGTLEEETPDSTFHQQRSQRMDVFQIDDGFHSDGGTETPPPSPSSGSSIASTSDHGSLDSVDTGGAQRLAVLSFEQVRKLNDVMDDTVYIHGRGNFPTLEVKLKDLVNLVRRKLESEISAGGAGVVVKDVRLNGGAASHVLASEDQPFNDLDLIYAIELTSSRHFDRVKNAVLNTLMDLLPDSTSKHRIMPCALKEAYVGKMVKVNNNNDGDRWSLISLGSKRGHKNVELKFVDTMRRQFEFTVDSFQIVLDSLLLFYDCAALPISENFYPTVVGESVYGDFQEAMYHLQKKLISTRQPEEIRGGGLLKYCNLLVRNFTPIDPQHIKILERYMCSRFFIDFPDINTQTLKLDGYLADHFCGVDEEPLQYQYLMHLREVVEMSTVCLMGHERRQTLLLIQYLAAQVLYKEHRKQQAQAEEQYQQHQQQHHHQQQQQQQQQHHQQQQQHQQIVDMQQTQQMYVQQQQQQQQQQQLLTNPTELYCTTVTETSATTGPPPPQTIQIPSGPLGLIYANGVYYAPVIPTTICTCNSTWLST